MKAITIIGRLTKDSKVHKNERGGFVAFSVAVDDGYGDDKGTMYFDVLYGRPQIGQYLTKGTQVAVTGELKTSEFSGKTYLSVRPSDVKLLGGKRDAQPQRDYQAPSTQLEDEIPF